MYDLDEHAVRAALDALNDGKWRLAVLLRLEREGEMKFGELLRAVHGIRTKALTQALRDLERSRLVDREVIRGVPVRVSYRLTRHAHRVIPILLALEQWYEDVSQAG